MLVGFLLLASPLPTIASNKIETIPTITTLDSFIYYGIVATITDEMKSFTQKYKVGFTNAGCLILNMDETESHNLQIAQRLTKELGHDDWIVELPFKIMGVN